MDQWTERLIEYETLRQANETEIAALTEQREALFAQHVAPLDEAIAALQARTTECEAAIRQDALNAFTTDGELNPHPKIHIQRRYKLVYEKDEVLTALEAEGDEDYIRIKKELKVREFEKAFRDGKLPYIQAEDVPNPVIAIDKLGDLLMTEAGD